MLAIFHASAGYPPLVTNPIVELDYAAALLSPIESNYQVVVTLERALLALTDTKSARTYARTIASEHVLIVAPFQWEGFEGLEVEAHNM